MWSTMIAAAVAHLQVMCWRVADVRISQIACVAGIGIDLQLLRCLRARWNTEVGAHLPAP
jgi:hypothetical protein